jgi:mannose/cellobiose epimerase-like protein (N-acyl-D-glucosamine 2-epimerase family)
VKQRLTGSAPELQRILERSILPFWRGRVVDHTHGGYHLNHDAKGRDLGPAPKHIIAQTRTLWFFSSVYASAWGRESDAEAARHGFEYLRRTMWDAKFGGFFWEVDVDGAPRAPHKHALAQCYAIYALSAFARVFDDHEALDLASKTFDSFDGNAHDDEYGGYREMSRRDWTDPAGLQGYWAGDPDLKLLDTHLHVLEGLCSLHELAPRPGVETRMRELLALMATVDAADPQGVTRFARDWTPQRKTRVEYGFDMKRIWLCEAAADTVGGASPTMTALDDALFDRAIELGWDSRDGGLFNAGRPGRRADELTKTWWTQAETLLASLWLWRRTHDPRHAAIYLASLDWIRDHQVDWEHGDWHEVVDHRGRASGRKAFAWKSPYHVTRAMLECLRMLDASGASDLSHLEGRLDEPSH